MLEYKKQFYDSKKLSELCLQKNVIYPNNNNLVCKIEFSNNLFFINNAEFKEIRRQINNMDW